MLVDITNTRAYLGITNTASDSILNLLMTFTQSAVESYLGRNLELATYSSEVLEFRQTHDDLGYDPLIKIGGEYPEIVLKNFPVITNTIAITSTQGVLSTSNYFVDINTGVIQINGIYNDNFGTLRASYVAGYTTATIPPALQMVILDGVKQLYSESGTTITGSGNVKSKKVGDFSVSYGDNNNSFVSVAQSGSTYMKRFIAENQYILDQYRNYLI